MVKYGILRELEKQRMHATALGDFESSQYQHINTSCHTQIVDIPEDMIYDLSQQKYVTHISKSSFADEPRISISPAPEPGMNDSDEFNRQKGSLNIPEITHGIVVRAIVHAPQSLGQDTLSCW